MIRENYVFNRLEELGLEMIPVKKVQQIFNNDLVARSTKVQKELLSKAIGLLKKDHEMVYSTCSILREENEEILENFIKTNKIEIVPINKDLFEDITLLPTTIEGTICVMPSKLYEGFFIAKIRKK